MTILNTPRWALPYPKDTSPRTDSPDVPRDVKALALALDNVAMDDQGTLANKPVSSSGAPGKKGRYYMVKGDPTASNNGILWRDNGTGWDPVGTGGTIVDTKANRPAATAVGIGTVFFATDQVVEWVSDGTNWIRLSTPAGTPVLLLADTADPGYVLLAGQAWPGTTGIYADLYAKLSGKFPANLPDPLGRSIVIKGSHADVDNVGDNDGLASGARRVRHKHVVNDPGHAHSATFDEYNDASATGNNPQGGDNGLFRTAYTVNVSSATTGISVGPQTGSEPVDGPAWFTFNLQAKL